jgi:hypothetical protein
MKLIAFCDGDFSERFDGTISCDGNWIFEAAYVPFDVTQIDPELATMLFTGGVFLTFTPWITAVGFSYILKMIR